MAIHKMPIYVNIGKNSATAYGGKAGKPRIVGASESKPTKLAEGVLAVLQFDIEIDEAILNPVMETGITVRVVPPPTPSKTPPTKTVVKGIVAELHQMEDDVEEFLNS